MSGVTAVAALGAQAEDLERLRAFYESMKRAGIAITREYDLPPLDTIGRRFLAIPGERRPACGAAAVGPRPALHERYEPSRRRADA